MPTRTPTLLMCPPDFFGVEYEINPWMDRQREVSRPIAQRQWSDLVAIFEALGAKIELVPPQSGLPDMCFAANAGLVRRPLFVPSRFRHAERQGESPFFEQWFADRGYDVQPLPSKADFEGAGDALFCGDALFAGYRFRSSIKAHQELGRLLGCQVLSVELVDPRFYHLDTCFCPLAPGMALWFPPAFDEYGQRAIREHVPTLVEAEESEAERFACNAVVIGRQVILNEGSSSVEGQLKELGFGTRSTPLGEFLKAGGAAKCLTLRLDGEEAATG